MLVDATWGRPPERVGVTWDVFDTSHGGLRMAMTFTDKSRRNRYSHTLAVRVQEGVYEACGLEHTIDEFSTNLRPRHVKLVFARGCEGGIDDDLILGYGYGDSIAQILEHEQRFVTAQRLFVLQIIEWDADKMGLGYHEGFRWHKNGQYIGNREPPQCEYFGDEPTLRHVFGFHFCEVEFRSPFQHIERDPQLPTQVTFTAEEVCNWNKDGG